MPRITIHIDAPEGCEITVVQDKQQRAEAPTPDEDAVETYWRDYLSDNGRRLYGAAADFELANGIGYTLSHIGQRMGKSYESARSYHRTSGRSARRWRDDGGGDAPIVLVDMGYSWDPEFDGMRTSYRLPEGVAEKIVTFS